MIDARFYHELSKIRVSKLAEKCGFNMIGSDQFLNLKILFLQSLVHIIPDEFFFY